MAEGNINGWFFCCYCALVLLNTCIAQLHPEAGVNVKLGAPSKSAVTDRPYKGRLIGKFREVKKDNADPSPTVGAAFKVSGSLYAVDDKLLYIDKFTYDGGISEVYLWGISTDERSKKNDVFIIPLVNDCVAAASCATLPAIWEESLLLALPRNISLTAVTKFAIGTRDTTVLFPKLKERLATLKIPAGFTPPEAQILRTSLGHTLSTGQVSSGKIIVQDSRRIFIERVTYDGSGQEAFFWVDRKPQPSLTGWKIPPNNEENPPAALRRLPPTDDRPYNVILDLRKAFRALTGNVQSVVVFDLKSIAIYDPVHGTVYGDAPFDGTSLQGKVPPALDDLTIQRISDKAAALVRELNYQIGVDNDIQAGPLTSVPRSPLLSPRIRLSLTDGMSNMQGDEAKHAGTQPVHQIRKRSEWTPFSEFHPAPPSPNRQLSSSDEWNCEVLDDILTLQWKIQGKFLLVSLSVPVSALPDRVASYIAVGFGGPKTKSQMIGSDVTLGYLAPDGITLVDMVLGGNVLCDPSRPAVNAFCPRVLVGGKQASRLVGDGGLSADGKVSFSYRRPLEAQDILGKDIPLDAPVLVGWAIGPMNLTSQLPEYHTAHSSATLPPFLHLGREPQDNCNSRLAQASEIPNALIITAQREEHVNPWTPMSWTMA
ncbi:hypothetical protein RvY_04754 [Ramazzottius varieornatus]|uniref:Uncharacterized protein n=1 Tax=Ramazzottius varieornatus TaxID=947166 RepID=A0A1D1USQ6_RAMVA|nr:hypothetical protein RvY_04754 [Ramazzottius varieornatus]